MNIGIGKVYTSRIQKPHFSGLGVYDPNKVFTNIDENGKVYVDDNLSVICKKNEVLPSNTVTIDGKVYNFVKIGEQYWLAENLDLKLSNMSYQPEGTPTSAAVWYYDNSEENKQYGLLYNYYCLASISYYLTTNNIGFHIPSVEEFDILKNTIEDTASKIKSTEMWETPGTDDYGMNVKPTGQRTGSFYSIGTAAFMWTSDNTGIAKYVNSSSTGILEQTRIKSWAASIRLVKD